MRILGFNIRGPRAIQVKHPDSIKQTKLKAQISFLNTFVDWASTQPEVAREIGSQVFGYKEAMTFEERLFRQAINNDESLRDEYIKDLRRKRGLASSDPFAQLKEMKESLQELGLFNNNRGLLSFLESPTASKYIDMFMAMLISNNPNMAKVLGMSRQNMISNNSRKQLVSGSVSGNNEEAAEEETVSIQSYIDFLAELISNKEITPENAAKEAVQGLYQLIQELMKTEDGAATAKQINNFVLQSPEVVIFMLKTLVAANGDARHVAVLEKLDSPEGREYMARFCAERDRIIQEMREKAAAKQE